MEPQIGPADWKTERRSHLPQNVQSLAPAPGATS